MCGPHFCSMKITGDVRAIAQGMEEKAQEFREGGLELYTAKAEKAEGAA